MGRFPFASLAFVALLLLAASGRAQDPLAEDEAAPVAEPPPPSPPFVPHILFGPRVNGVLSVGGQPDAWWSIGGEGAFRFSDDSMVGIATDMALPAGPTADTNPPATSSAALVDVDAFFRVITSPRHVGAMFQASLGYGAMRIGPQGTWVGETSHWFGSAEASLATGVWIPVSRVVIVPRLEIGGSGISPATEDSSFCIRVTFGLAVLYNLGLR